MAGYYRGRPRRYDPRAEERRERQKRQEARIARGRARLALLMRRYRKVPIAGDAASHAWQQPELRSYPVGQTMNEGDVVVIIRGSVAQDRLYLQEPGSVGWRFYKLVPRYHVPRASEVERSREKRRARSKRQTYRTSGTHRRD